MKMNYPLILMRHGEAEHNKVKKSLKLQLNTKKIKGTPEFQEIKRIK